MSGPFSLDISASVYALHLVCETRVKCKKQTKFIFDFVTLTFVKHSR